MRTLSLASTILATLLAFLATASAHDSHEHIGINNNNNNNQQLVFSLSETSTADSILANHDKIDEQNAHVKKFKSGDTLAYVTPWNNRGYDVAKDFKGKFDYVSPVWYYVERRAADDYEFFGEHDVDHDWMDQVRGEMEDGRKVGKIVPRFQFRNWKLQDYQSFASNNVNEGYILAQRILEQVLEHDFDGIVLECGYPTLFPHFIKNLGIGLHHAGKELVVVIPPIRTEEQKQLLDADMFETLAQVIDKFSIMTYDYSSHIPTGGPSAPVDWIIDNIEWLTNDENANKLLVGLNMYAMAYTETAAPEPMLLKNVLERLPGAELVWDKESEEHWFIDLETRKKIWLPTRKSIKNRLHIAEDYGVGLSLWEVGQGLDYWYDLF